ncbi:MAG: ABC transporter ATP-binding protein [Oscillospiraceae bacterium]|jgi:ABC-2 type transport system ATP-binding protein|nr:ABC transporter ATP-binding protein [Oscillospiraceae bacterium]
MNNYAIEIKGLTKTYGSHKAIDNMSLSLEPNKIYGLLGRNGAGKTTLLNILTGRLFADAGKGNVKVFGSPVYENVDILKQICYVEEKGFYSGVLKVSDILSVVRGLYPTWDMEYEKRLLLLFELDTRKQYRQLSRGMESSLGLVIGLASRAPLTIFDEPSLGLDAVIRERFYSEIIEDFTENPRTVIISTHLIDEVNSLFEEVVIVNDGKLLLKADCAELKSKGFYLSGREEAVRKAAEGAVVLSEERFGGSLTLSVYSEKEIAPTEGAEVQPMSLQKLFVELINPMIHEQLVKGGIVK